jgi:hypothetical protein
MALAIDDLLPTARELKPANTASNCIGLTGQAKGLCIAYNSGVKSETAQATIADQYLEATGEGIPGMALTPFPNHDILQETVAAYISGAGTWNGYIGDVYYGYVKR